MVSHLASLKPSKMGAKGVTVGNEVVATMLREAAAWKSGYRERTV
jgi:hypothetical protein